jgi:cell division protein FtsL|tara:strand:- start:475 stop:744 length:270 start_codon:yes stop_codon:yes gene_type:complete
MSNITTEKAWKIFTVTLGAVILPLAGWVWNTNVAVAQIQNDLHDAEDTIVALEQKVEEAEENAKAIISIEKDIEYMKATLSRIERLVTE